VALVVDATESLTRLLVASLKEDDFGKVHSDVAGVVKLFAQTIITLEEFMGEEGGLPIHWTDVDFPAEKADAETRLVARKVEEVEIVLSTMKAGLAELLKTYQPYLADVGVKGKDLKLAKQAAADIETNGKS
jgi:nucleoporin NDC1